MSTITFDTHKFVKELTASGVPDAQAEAFVQAQQEILSQVLDTTIATKADVLTLEKSMRFDLERIERKLIEHDGKLTLLQWMIGFNLVFTMAVLWKVFG